MERYFTIGNIINSHGLKGEVKVYPVTDEPGRFELLDEAEVTKNDYSRILSFENVRYHKNLIILKFKEINSIEEAEKLKGAKLRIPESKALPLEDDEYYQADLYDINVQLENGEHLGILTDILRTGANDVYVVKDGESEILIPAIKSCVLNVDIKSKKMIVKLLEGMAD